MSTANLEETYQLKEQRRHILENGDTYVGSVEEDEICLLYTSDAADE